MSKKVVEIRPGTKDKVRGRPFEPGNKLGKGRPKGSRNKAQPEEALMEEYAPHLVRKCIALAMQGDGSAMRLCMERINPARRGACIQMSLPPIKAEADIDKAAEKVTQAISRGQLTPTEGGTMMNILEGRSRVIEKVQLESRIEKMEQELAAANRRRAVLGKTAGGKKVLK
jgi:hypothetical protein